MDDIFGDIAQPRLHNESRQPLGYAMVGGLALSQLLTLYTTPVVYLYLDRLQHWLSGRGGEACPRCRNVIVRVKANGRSSFFCPHCQI